MNKIDELYNQIKTGSKKEAHSAARELNNLFYKNSEQKKDKEFIKRVLADYGNIPEDNKAASISAISWLVFRPGCDLKNELSNFIVENIQHEKGAIREQTRKMTSYFLMSVCIPRKENKDEAEILVSLAKQLLELSKKYKMKEGLSDEVYLDDLKPCVYKSLQLLLEDITGHEGYLNILHRAGIDLIPHLGTVNDDVENEPLALERKPIVYRWVSVDKKILDPLYLMAVRRLKKELADFGIEGQEAKNIIHKFENMSEEEIQSCFVALIIDIADKNNVINLEDLNPVAREVQSLANHIVYKSKSGSDYNSRFSLNIQRLKNEMGYEKPKDLNEYLSLCFAAHLKVDEFFDLLEKERKKQEKEWQKFLKDHNIKEDIRDDNEVQSDLESMNGISHHALDWYLQEDCNTAQRKTPEKLAMAAVYFVEKFNAELTNYYFHMVRDETMAEFGGWAGPGSVSSSLRYSAYYSIIYAITDPNLMIVSRKKLAKDWEKRLKEMIPTLDEE